jgi:hypothetical protein
LPAIRHQRQVDIGRREHQLDVLPEQPVQQAHGAVDDVVEIERLVARCIVA